MLTLPETTRGRSERAMFSVLGEKSLSMIFWTHSAYGESIARMISVATSFGQLRVARAGQRAPRTTLVELLAELHPPKDLAFLPVAQLAVEAVAQSFPVEQLFRFPWKFLVHVPFAARARL